MFYYYIFFLFIYSIKSCPLKTVDSRSGCYCGIEIDGTNYIQCQPYSIEIIPEFTRSYIHDKLNLSSNFIRNITKESFNKLRVKKIYLQQNLIEHIDKESFNNNILNYLEELRIDMLNNGSLEFLCYGAWQKLRLLELSGFNFDQHQICFEKLHRLEKLIIKNSKISFLSHHLYQLPYLYELSLINNYIEYLNFDNDLLATFSSSIKVFNLTSNQLRTIPNDLFTRMPHLHTLDISHNFLESLPIINQINLLNISLTHNLINYIQLNDNQNNYDLSFNPICTLEKSESKTNLLLKNITHLHCDCRLAFYLDENLVNKSEIIGIQRPFDSETKCSTPFVFNGFYLKDLTYEQLLSSCSNDLPMSFNDIIPTSDDISSFRLTSFYTMFDNNNLLIDWDFDPIFSTTSLSQLQFQITVEQETSLNTQIIRRSGFISPYLKQYTIHHIPSNKNYYVCLLLTRSSVGTDKYCREARPTIITTTAISNTILSKQAVVHMLFTNRSILFGFLFGAILTTSLLLALAFLCHLRSKRQRYQRAASSLYHHSHRHPLQQQKHYLYIDRNEDDGAYSNSVFSSSSSSSKFNHFRRNPRRACFPSLPPNQSWYHRGLKELPTAPLPSTCCFHHHHHHHTPDTTMSSSTTARRITSLSSQYSNEMDKERMTSTSIMSSTSSDEHAHNSPAKHLYEELADETTMLRLNNTTDVFL
ncbi:unnamed protein product [Rotaria socialis]|uniref:Uncharacterized protein n=1 Tax=Rotaria socialis TaxID=392032 RepID=A0A821LHL5_9BILA|nr:unnamed protein product [Rotaria socialis]